MKINIKTATLADADLYYQWANDDLVRQNSYEQSKISYDDHVAWFKRKLQSTDCFFYLFEAENKPVGQVRIENRSEEIVIGISIDPNYRGKGLGPILLEMAIEEYFKKFPKARICAYIKETNAASYAIFKKANFKNDEFVMVNGIKSIKLCKTYNDEF